MRPNPAPSPVMRTSLGFVLVAVVCLFLSDIEVSTLDPWGELGRLGLGLVTPDFSATGRLLESLMHTIAFALLGVTVGNVLGFALAFVFDYKIVQVGCAIVRSVHELFWALIFLQIFGLTLWTGIFAIGIPYAGIIAKVYAEILEEADPAPVRALAPGTGRVSAFLYARLPDVLGHFKSYSLYRMECGLRSSAVLGFVGLPTLGFHLESAFAQGNYSEAAALLMIFWLVIATIRVWLRRSLLVFYLLAAFWVLPQGLPVSMASVWRFFTHDIVPHPMRSADVLDVSVLWSTVDWFASLFNNQIAPGVINTLLLTMVALVVTGMLTLVLFPLISPLFFSAWTRRVNHVFLVILRSTPEYILAYIGLQLWGPSMLPAIVALSLHNAGIIAHLVGRFTEAMRVPPSSPRGLNLYAYVALPQAYSQFLAFLFYRWEVILRETAILGMIGIPTLGFYIDSAFADIRFDRAVVLIAVTAALNIVVDFLSRYIRARLRLRTSFTTT